MLACGNGQREARREGALPSTEAAAKAEAEAKALRAEQGRYLRSFVVKLASVAVLVALVFAFVFGVATVQGESMYPRIRDGDTYLFYRLAPDYRIGDVVTFEQGGMRHVARIVAVGGDTVDTSETGDLIVNGHVQDEETPCRMTRAEVAASLPCEVEEGSYFLLCDSRAEGLDSRSLGAVAESDVDGKVISLLRRRGI